MHKYLLEFKRAPGDTLMMTALVRDLKRTFPDIQVDVRTRYPGLWRHNPHLTPLDSHAKDVQYLNLGGYTNAAADIAGLLASQQGVRLHYLTAFHRAFAKATGLQVPCLEPKPDLHLSEEERTKPYVEGRYWIVVPGGKLDMTAKWWPAGCWQRLVMAMGMCGLPCVQEGCRKPLHVHPSLAGVLNLVGETSIRDMIVNIHHSQGVVCGVTLQMHLAAALERPCVVIAGGREEPWYEHYTDQYAAFGPSAGPVAVPHAFLETLGRLECCRERGCWRRRTLALHDNFPNYERPNRLCLRPEMAGVEPVPACLAMIELREVLESVLAYRTLPTESKAPPRLLRATELMRERLLNSPMANPPSPQPGGQVS